MKRSEIKVGDVLFYAEGNDYMEKSYTRTGKAVVKMIAARDVRPSYDRRSPADYRAIEPGSRDYGKARVLVEITDEYRGSYQRLVPLASLRGPYAEVKAAREKRLMEIRQENAARDAAAKSARARAETLEAAYGELLGGQTPYRAGVDIQGLYGDSPRITLTLDAAETLLRRLQVAESGLQELSRDLANM